MMQHIVFWASVACLVVSSHGFAAEPPDTNYDESKVPAYELPRLLVDADGRPVKNRKQWLGHRRAEILRLFEESVYGRTPTRKLPVRYAVTEMNKQALGGQATRKQISAFFGDDQLRADILLYVPNAKAGKPVPAFLGLNFYGNQTIHSDPEIQINRRWMRDNSAIGIKNNRATEQTRGAYASRWQVETVLRRGYALATLYCGDVMENESTT